MKTNFKYYSLLWVVILLFSYNNYYSQVDNNSCGTDDVVSDLLNQIPEYADSRSAFLNDYLANIQGFEKTNDEYVIPCVVHVMHNGNVGLIPESQVYTAIDMLNEQLETANFGLDINIRVELAKLDPNGNCTNGIVYSELEVSSVSASLDFAAGPCESNSDMCCGDGSYVCGETISHVGMCLNNQWPSENCLNIYTIDDIPGSSLAYTRLLPGFTLNQFFWPGPGWVDFGDIDAIVCENDVFGIEWPYDEDYVNIGGLLTTQKETILLHEVGHYLGLCHPWACPTFDGETYDECHPNSESLTEGDLIEDTPPMTGTSGCSPFDPNVNTCNADVPDLNDPGWSYMSYGYACHSYFSQGQAEKMYYTLENFTPRINLYSESNLIATGLLNEIATNSSNYSNQSINFGSNLIIPDGVNITISNSTLLFDQDYGITVEEGGKLTLSNTIVRDNDCSDYWQGIEVRGTPSQYQGPNPNNGYGWHGVVRLLNGTSIEHALIGVTNSARNDNFGGPLHSGGKIIAADASFVDCREAVRIQKYTNTGVFPLHCQFSNTDFTWTDQYPFPNFFPMVRMIWAKKVKFMGCNFNNTNTDLFTGTNNSHYHAAIYMTQSSINMDDNGSNESKMIGFNYGIVNFSKVASSIRNTEFRNYRSIWQYKNKATRITENQFYNMTTNLENIAGSESNNNNDPVWQAHYGIYMEYSTAYWIEGNDFNFPNDNVNEAGIFVRASGESYNQLYDNDFTDCHYAVIAYDDNQSQSTLNGLKLSCNDFSQNDLDILVDYISTPQNGWGISRYQGSNFSSAGNQFDLGTEIKLDNYLDGIVYFTTSFENINQSNVSGNVLISGNTSPNQCLSNLGKSKDEKRLSALEYKNEAISFRNQLENLVDGGDTEALTDEVIYSDYTEALELYYELMSKSPNLSVKVMEEAIDKEYTLPPVLLTLILQSNPTAGKSSKLQSKLDDRMIPLNEYQRYMIDQGKELISEKEYLEAKVAYNELKFTSQMNQAINLILFDDEIENKEVEIDYLLSGYEEIDHHYMKIDRALENEDYIIAQNVLNNIPTEFDLKDRQNQEWNDYLITYQILIDLEQNDTQSLSSAQLDDLMTITSKHSNSAAGLAWQILEQYSDTYVLEGLIAPGSHEKSLVRTGKDEVINPYEDLKYIRVFPNPVDDITVLEFVGYESELTLKLLDPKGKLVLSNSFEGKDLQKVLKLGEYSAGLYTLIISDNVNVIFSEKIIIKH